MSNEKSQRVLEVRNQAGNYQETVHTMLAFAALVCHDGHQIRSDSQFGLGRRMDTSSHNAVEPSASVTPDVVVQKNGSYGIVGEVKKTLPVEQSHWPETVKQLRKYDDSLVGWWTANEQVGQSDAVLLIHQSRGRAFSALLDAQRREFPDSVGPSTAVVEFNRSDEVSPYIFFRHEWGALRDTELSGVLHTGRQVPIEKVLLSFPTVRYCDAKPPVESLMVELWLDAVGSRAASLAPNQDTGWTDVATDVDELADEMQRAYGSRALHCDQRSPEFPKPTWIREALDALVAIGFATKRSGNSYIVHHRTLRGRDDLLERFATLREKQLTKRKPRLEQTGLPFENTDEPGKH